MTMIFISLYLILVSVDWEKFNDKKIGFERLFATKMENTVSQTSYNIEWTIVYNIYEFLKISQSGKLL